MSAVGRRESALQIVMQFLGTEYAPAERIKKMKFGEVVRCLLALNAANFDALGRCCKAVKPLPAFRLLQKQLRVTYVVAAMFGQVPVIAQPTLTEGHQLLDRCIERRNASGQTALMRNVGSVDRARALIAVGADVNAKNGEGRTALWLAVDRRPSTSEVVKVLLDAGADGSQALILAAWRPHGCVQQLLDAHVDPNAQDDEGHRPLSRAIEIGAVNTVRRLLKARASVHFEVHGGCSPLHLATGPHGNAEIVALLLSHNASVNEATAKGFTALMRAATYRHGDVVRTLIAAQANVYASDESGRTALSMARGHEAIIQQLRDAGAER